MYPDQQAVSLCLAVRTVARTLQALKMDSRAQASCTGMRSGYGRMGAPTPDTLPVGILPQDRGDLAWRVTAHQLLTFIRKHGEVTPVENRALFPDRARRSVTRDTGALVDAGLVEMIGSAKAIRYRLRIQGE